MSVEKASKCAIKHEGKYFFSQGSSRYIRRKNLDKPSPFLLAPSCWHKGKIISNWFLFCMHDPTQQLARRIQWHAQIILYIRGGLYHWLWVLCSWVLMPILPQPRSINYAHFLSFTFTLISIKSENTPALIKTVVSFRKVLKSYHVFPNAIKVDVNTKKNWHYGGRAGFTPVWGTGQKTTNSPRIPNLHCNFTWDAIGIWVLGGGRKHTWRVRAYRKLLWLWVHNIQKTFPIVLGEHLYLVAESTAGTSHCPTPLSVIQCLNTDRELFSRCPCFNQLLSICRCQGDLGMGNSICLIKDTSFSVTAAIQGLW